MNDFARDRNPLRLDLLPDDWKERALEFSYRTEATREGEYQNPFPAYIVVSVGLCTLAALLVLRFFAIVVEVETILRSPWLFAVLTLAALAEAVPAFQRDEAPRFWLFRLALPFIVWAAVALIMLPSWLLLILLLLGSLLLCDLIANHYLRYLLADSRLDFNTRKRIEKRWDERFSPLALRAALWTLFAPRLYRDELFDLYLVGYLALPEI